MELLHFLTFWKCINHSRVLSKISRLQMFFKIGVLKNFAIFTGKNLCWGLFLIKLQVWGPEALFKKRIQHSCSPVNIANFNNTFFYRTTPVAASVYLVVYFEIPRNTLLIWLVCQLIPYWNMIILFHLNLNL